LAKSAVGVDYRYDQAEATNNELTVQSAHVGFINSKNIKITDELLEQLHDSGIFEKVIND
jgi:hypothetical protein